MLSDFFSPSEVIRDKTFWRNLFLSLLGVVISGSLFGFALTFNKIKIYPIGKVVVDVTPTSPANKPISQIVSASKTEEAQEYAGWVVNLNELCQKGDYSDQNKPSVILIQNETGAVTAATTHLSKEACERIRKLTGETSSERLFAAYDDIPFRNIEAAKIYVKLDANQK